MTSQPLSHDISASATNVLSAAASDYVAFVRAGDAQALDRALHACANHAYTQAYRRLGNASDADDAVQEAFLQLVRHADKFDGTIPFQVWLALMVKTSCLRLLRSDRRRRVREGKAMTRAESHPEPEPDHRLAEEVRAKVALLSRADATVIELHYFAGLSQAEVATAIGTSENAVTLRLSRARNKLRTLLGGKVSAAAVASLLGAQQAYAAPPQILTGITSLSKTVALGQTLPAHVIPLTISQKALLFMSLHPISTCACAALLIAGGLIPVFMPAAETPPPVAETTTPPSGEIPWQGKAKELLPFIDPDAPFHMAVDWQHLRQLAPNTKITSVLSDERSQKSLAHIAKQFEFLAQNDHDVPDFFKLITQGNGFVYTFTDKPSFGALGFYAALDDVSAEKMVRSFKDNERITKSTTPEKVSSYETWPGPGDTIVARAGGIFARCLPENLQAGLTRTAITPPTVPLHARIDYRKDIAALAQLTDKYGDAYKLDARLGDTWRQSQPILSIDGTAEDGIWRTRANLHGNLQLPLRAVSPDIAGCVTKGNLGSLIIGCELKQTLALVEAIIGTNEFMQLLGSLNVDETTLLQCLTGDIACMVRQGPIFPEGTVVMGLQDQTADLLAKKIEPYLKQAGLSPVGNDGTQWEGFSPIGKILVQFSKNRLVIHLSNDALKLADEKPTSTHALAIDIDLQAVARSYLPMLMSAMPTPSQPMYFDSPLERMLDDIMTEIQSLPEGDQNKNLCINLDKIDSSHANSMRAQWEKLTGGKNLPLEPHIAVFAPEKNFNERDGIIRNGLFVFRTPTGWRIITRAHYQDMSTKDVTELTEVKAMLKGRKLVCGVDVANLAVFNVPERATFDIRWFPPLTAILDHIPAYHLHVQKTADGYAAIEDGLPISFLSYLGVSWLSADIVPAVITPDDRPYNNERLQASVLERNFSDAAAAMHANDMEMKYKEAIKAVNEVRKALGKRDHRTEPILLTPSSAFAAAGVPLAALAPLFNNVPPTPAQVDALGFYHPNPYDDGYHHQFEWLVPIEKNLFIEFTWWARNGQFEGAQISALPLIDPKPLTADQLAKLAALNEERKAEKEQQQRQPRAPAPKPKPEEANSF